MLRLSILWTLCLALAPVLVVQGLWARRTVPRLPEGKPPNQGRFGTAGNSVRVIGIGDSVIAGVGCDDMAESLTASVARVLHERQSLYVEWAAHGCNGDRIRDVIQKVSFIPAPQPSFLIVSAGVNDVSGLTSMIRWQLEVTSLISTLKERFEAPIILLGVPPMGRFPGLPQPLRFGLGIRARMLDYALRHTAETVPKVYWVDTTDAFDNNLLAADGYHPSADACTRWANRIVDTALIEQLFTG